MAEVTVWFQVPAEERHTPTRVGSGKPLKIGRKRRDFDTHNDGVALAIIATNDIATNDPVGVAAAIIRDSAFVVEVNSVAIRPGLHLLKHEDRVSVAGVEFWISSSREPLETTYDPATHGQEMYCFRTKARLRAEEPIVICPGTPGTSCGMLYKRSAWQVDLACHHCRFDPAAPSWRPPVPKSGSRLNELFTLIEDYAANGS